MRALSLMIILLVIPDQQLAAQGTRFPYQAKVVVAEVFVRSGAGESWLPTQRLQLGAVVNVHRHDPGGWYMIEPPEGSFSWLPARFVKQSGDADGEVIENNVVAFVGSDFGDDTTVWQRRLSLGEKVRILGQQEVQTLSGKQLMLRIAPPRREFRWIPGVSVVPADEQLRKQMDHDPYATPSNVVRKSPPVATEQGSQGGVSDVPQLNPDSQLARLRRIRSEQAQLAEIDEKFRQMIFQDPATWNLDSIQQAYQSLQRETSYKPIAGQIDLRYPAIDRYRRKLAEYLDFKRLTSETERRDAAIVARLNPHFGHAPAIARVSASRDLSVAVSGLPTTESISRSDVTGVTEFAPTPGSAETTSPGDAVSTDSVSTGWINSPSDFPALTISAADDGQGWEFVGGAPLQESLPETSTPLTTAPVSMNPTDSESRVPETSDHPRSRYIGAGIIQRSANVSIDTTAGTEMSTETKETFVLAAPSGRVLAHLKPSASISLQDFVGQSVGLHGSRAYHPELKTDVIEVSGLEPVHIR